MNTFDLFLLAYLVGSIPFGKIIGRYLYDTDIQKRGSGNIGFANVRRILGWRAGILTLAGDILKGALPTYIALQTVSDTVAFFVGLTAVIGHIFPIWLRFRGGKGVATGLGVLGVLQPVAALIGMLMYVLVVSQKIRSSTASLMGLATVSIIGTYLLPETFWWYIILTSVALWTLRDNLRGKVPDYDT